MSDTRIPNKPGEQIAETVVVRTGYPGQSLRVVLVRGQSPYVGESWPASEEDVEAELVIQSGHRLVVKDGGIRVERLGNTPARSMPGTPWHDKEEDE